MESRTIGKPHLQSLACHEMVRIVPRFSMDTISLLDGPYGPFISLQEIEVPMWLALILQNAKMCQIKAPLWVSVRNLQSILQYEKENSSYYPLVENFEDILKVFTQDCPEALENNSSDTIGKLIGEVKLVRWTKILKDLDVFRQTGIKTPGLKISNLTSSEIDNLRPIMLRILDDGADFQNVVDNLARRSANINSMDLNYSLTQEHDYTTSASQPTETPSINAMESSLDDNFRRRRAV